MMDFDEITRILGMMKEHELTEFELERDNFKLRIRKQGGGHWVAASPQPQHAYAPPVAPPAPAVAAQAASPVLAAANDEMELAIVKSPIVGTFYSAPEPGANPYVSVGDTVQKGQILCIIEAMKLMNEIQAEISGEVVKVYVENGHAVQYSERLFAIKPA
jgi:acetyl-CoA carboxylase biotin carboxyl carrier protein